MIAPEPPNTSSSEQVTLQNQFWTSR
jgi:hypothetical protein